MTDNPQQQTDPNSPPRYGYPVTAQPSGPADQPGEPKGEADCQPSKAGPDAPDVPGPEECHRPCHCPSTPGTSSDCIDALISAQMKEACQARLA